MPKGSKVLMADDDKMLLDMYKERLELAGYVVQSYYNGEDAIAHVHDFVPDIIMLDVMMPKMNGYETLASLKSDPTTKNIPVVMLSALMRDFNREKAVEGGAEDYLIKSEAMPSDVITKIEQVLQKFGKGSTPPPGTTPSPTSPTVPGASGPSELGNQMSPPPIIPPVQESSTASDMPAAVPTPSASLEPTPINPILPQNNGSEPITESSKTESVDLAGKVFTTPPIDVQAVDMSKIQRDQLNPENQAGEKKDGETLIFEPDDSTSGLVGKEASPITDTVGLAEVAKVTEVAPPPVVTNVASQSVPEIPLEEDTTMEEVARSNWVVPLVVSLIVILLGIGGFAFYFAFLKK